MKTKQPKKNFAEKAYRYTHIQAGQTQEKLTTMLNEIGITDVRITQQGLDYTIEFIVRMKHGEAPRKVRMNVPFNTELGEDIRRQARRKDAIFRVLYWHIRDKFIAVQNGLKEFEEEFLADLVVMSKGQEIRLGDMLVPRYKEMLKDSKVAVFSIQSGE